MKLSQVIVGIVMGLGLASSPARVDAQPVDCEAARCAIQAEIDAECPCAEAKNHGRHTACVARIVNRAAREGTVPKKCRNAINGCAIRSTCGKRASVVLCDLPGDGVSGRCRPLSSAAQCEKRGGEIVSSCCATCGGTEPTPTATSTAPSPTPTPGAPTPTESAAAATATPEEPVATPTESAAEATATPEEPIATPTSTPETPIATATPEEPVATATPEEPVATATPEEPVSTATPEEPTPTPTTETPV